MIIDNNDNKFPTSIYQPFSIEKKKCGQSPSISFKTLKIQTNVINNSDMEILGPIRITFFFHHPKAWSTPDVSVRSVWLSADVWHHFISFAPLVFLSRRKFPNRAPLKTFDCRTEMPGQRGGRTVALSVWSAKLQALYTSSHRDPPDNCEVNSALQPHLAEKRNGQKNVVKWFKQMQASSSLV